MYSIVQPVEACGEVEEQLLRTLKVRAKCRDALHCRGADRGARFNLFEPLKAHCRQRIPHTHRTPCPGGIKSLIGLSTSDTPYQHSTQRTSATPRSTCLLLPADTDFCPAHRQPKAARTTPYSVQTRLSAPARTASFPQYQLICLYAPFTSRHLQITPLPILSASMTNRSLL